MNTRIDATALLGRLYKYFTEHSDLPAVIDDQQIMTFGELGRASESLAKLILKNHAPCCTNGNHELEGIPAVCVRMPRTIENVVAWVAAARAGVPYIPIALDWPEARVKRILSRCDVRLAFTVQEVAGKWKWPTEIQEVDLKDEIKKSLADCQVATPFPIENAAHAILYLIHTSGSTGDPKGVAITHANMMSQYSDLSIYRMPPYGRMIHACALSFDVSMGEVWAALINGCAVVVADTQVFLDAAIYREFTAKHKVDLGFIPTAVFNGLSLQDPAVFSNIKGLIMGGEVPNSETVAASVKACPSTAIFNCYGPAECTVGATFELITQDSFNGPLLTAGYATPGACINIVDEDLNLLPREQAGEICISGDCVGLGYLADRERMQHSFVFLPETGQRSYRTGDRGMLTKDGKLLVLGRMDDQVKISGYRVSPTEIAAVLLKLPKVRNVHVGTTQKEPPELVAWIVGDNTRQDISLEEEVRLTLEHQLPPYMIPAHIFRMDDLPKTPNGKVDIAQLPLGTAQDSDQEKETVLQLFRETLSNESFKETDSYLAHGGNSVKTIWLIARIRAITGVSIPVTMFLQENTVEAIDLYVDNALLAEPPICPEDVFAPDTASVDLEQQSILMRF